MKQNIRERTILCAEYIRDHRCTVRQAANIFEMGKSTVHTDVTKRLPLIDPALYREVHVILRENHDNRHLRGGESTRIKYLLEKQNKAERK